MLIKLKSATSRSILYTTKLGKLNMFIQISKDYNKSITIYNFLKAKKALHLFIINCKALKVQ